jgi:hypothetical protein
MQALVTHAKVHCLSEEANMTTNLAVETTLWEYKSALVGSMAWSKSPEEVFNKLGREGWELVAVSLQNGGSGLTGGLEAYFKRPLRG